MKVALQSGMLKLPERIRLMYSLGKVLGTLPVANIMEYLNVILSPSFEEIQNLINLDPVSYSCLLNANTFFYAQFRDCNYYSL